MRFGNARRHDDALARGKSVGLDDDRRAALRDEGLGVVRALKGAVLGGRDAVPRHEAFREILGRLELRCGTRRSEDFEPRVAKDIDDARGERRFGPDHGEMDFLLAREVDERRQLGDRRILEPVFARRAAVAGRDEYFLHARALRQLPRDGVLAATRADDEKLHG